VEYQRERILLAGDLPSPAAPPAGCRFHTRCPWRQPQRCDDERPALRSIDSPHIPAEHKVACHWAEDILAGRLQPHAVRAEAIELDDTISPDVGLAGPASVTEILNP